MEYVYKYYTICIYTPSWINFIVRKQPREHRPFRFSRLIKLELLSSPSRIRFSKKYNQLLATMNENQQ